MYYSLNNDNLSIINLKILKERNICIFNFLDYTLLILLLSSTISVIMASNSLDEIFSCDNQKESSSKLSSSALIRLMIPKILASGARTLWDCIHAMSLNLSFWDSMVFIRFRVLVISFDCTISRSTEFL